MRSLGAVLVLAALAGCGGGSAPNGGRTRFLLLAHASLAGQLSTSPDDRLLDMGRRACAEMDMNVPSDRIVADLGNDPEPGSAEFNAYSYVVVAAASQLCPQHKASFGAPLPAG